MLALSCALVSSVARADNKEHAKQLYAQGLKHYNLAEYDQALEAFKEGYREHEDPIFLYNVAQCYRQKNDKKEALRFYRSYLRGAPNAANHEQVAAVITTLEGEVAVEDKRAADEAAAAAQAAAAAAAATQAAATTSPAVDLTAHAPEKTPVYKKKWFWPVVVGSVVVVGLAVGLGVGLGIPPSNPHASMGAYPVNP